MDSFGTFVALFLILLLIIPFIILYFNKIKNEKINDFVQKHSIALKNLRSINQKTNFYDIKKRKYEHSYDNQIMYNEISCVDYLIYQLQYDKTQVLAEMNKVLFNNNHIETYIEEVNKIKLFGNFDIQPEPLNYNAIIEREKQIFEEETLHPILDYKINIQLYHVKMNGVIWEEKHDSINETMIKYLIKELNNKSGTFYINKNIWDSIARVERGKISNKMRFYILKRDNYRCKCCGRSGNEVNLEIDHILPISKGGKSVYDNLQTLCEDCNKNKGTKYQRY